jgi:hypothetical protein
MSMLTPTVFRVPTPEELAQNKAKRVEGIAETINTIDSDNLLAKDNILERVIWQKTTNGHVLVTKESHDEILQSLTDSGTEKARRVPIATPAVLTMVCKVSADGTFLNPEGGFPGPFTNHLTNTKLQLAVEPPVEEAWAKDYNKSVQVLEDLLVQVSNSTHRTRVGFKSKDGDEVRLKHTLFEVCPSS